MEFEKRNCIHCRKEFSVSVGSGQRLCNIHLIERYVEGTLRVCDQCSKTWKVDQGECGYVVVTESGKALELCSDCENQYIEKEG